MAAATATAFKRPAWRTALTAAFVVLLVWPSARSVVMFDALLARDDSRLVTRRWVESRFPAGTTIAQIAPDGGVVFWHDETEVPYLTSTELPRSGPRPTVVIVQSSPLRSPRDDMGDVNAILKADYQRAFEQHVVPLDPGNVYDLQDEFYLPLTGFRGIVRPGPNLDVYVLKDHR